MGEKSPLFQTMTQYMLTVYQFEREYYHKVKFYLTASAPDGYCTGLMNCNLLSEYLPDGEHINEDSTTTMVLLCEDFEEMLQKIQKDWDKWCKWLDTDRCK